jgi:hypothetical protein
MILEFVEQLLAKTRAGGGDRTLAVYMQPQHWRALRAEVFGPDDQREKFSVLGAEVLASKYVAPDMVYAMPPIDPIPVTPA